MREDRIMKKIIGIIALALAMAACNKNEINVQPITINATLAPKTSGGKAVNEGTNTIISSWETGEHMAILYEVSGTKYAADAEIIAVDGSGSATISFTVEAGTSDDTDCQIIYPLSAAKDDNSGVKDAATLLAAQDGRLDASMDVRVGAGKIQVSTPGLDVTTQPAAQFAIFKLTVKNAAGDATMDVKPLTVTIGEQQYVITPESATSVLFAALPAVSGQTVSFSITGSDSNTYSCSKGGVTFSAGYYYQSTLKMKPNCTYTAPTGLTGLVFNGGIDNIDGSPQDLVIAGSADNATIYYSIDDGSNWSTSIPTATNAGKYTVLYKVVPNEGYSGGVESASLDEIVISKAEGWCQFSSESSTGWSTEKGKKVIIHMNSHGGKMSYGKSTGNLTDKNNLTVSISTDHITISTRNNTVLEGTVPINFTCASTTNYRSATARYCCYK